MIFKNFLGKRNKNIKSFIYDRDEVEKLKDKYLKTSSPALSPIIKANLKAIRNYRNGDSKALDSFIPKGTDINIYLEELAKTHIFVSANIKCNNSVLKQMYIETAFASYEYQKDNNLFFEKFDKFFNTDESSPFAKMKWIDTNSWDFAFLEDTNGKCRFNHISLNIYTGMVFDKYTTSVNETLTHEEQHKVSDNGTYQNKKENYKDIAFNEMCTEKYQIEIVERYMDKNIKPVRIKQRETKNELKTVFSNMLKSIRKDKQEIFEYERDNYDTLVLKDKSEKKVFFNNKAKDYREVIQFYDSIDYISDYRLRAMYYDRSKNIDSLDGIFKKYKEDILDFVYIANNSLYEKDKVYPVDYINHKYSEERFDTMINSFSSLAEKYVRELKFNKSTTPESYEGAIIFKKVEEFFKTFESISFKKEGDKFFQRDLIKEKILGAIYYNDKSSEEAINRLNNKRTFVKEFEDNCKTATKTIEKFEKQKECELTKDIDYVVNKDKKNLKTIENEVSEFLEQ